MIKMNKQQTSVQERFVSGPLKFLSCFSVSPVDKKKNVLIRNDESGFVYIDKQKRWLKLRVGICWK